MLKPELSWQEFEKVDIRVGTIISVDHFPEAKKPAYKLTIDFGELGTMASSAQITDLYTPSNLLHRQIIAIVNFPPKQIANFMSECLLMGAVGDPKGVVLLGMEERVENGLRVS